MAVHLVNLELFIGEMSRLTTCYEPLMVIRFCNQEIHVFTILFSYDQTKSSS